MEAATITRKPAVTPELRQCMEALDRANRIRFARAELKRNISRGEISVSQVVRTCPWEAETMTLLELLTSQNRWGPTRSRRLLEDVALSQHKLLGTLTPRQRELLCFILSERKVCSSPARTVRQDGWQEQRAIALKRANAVRAARAELKKDLKEGKANIATILFDPPDYTKTMKVFELIRAVPKLGRVKTNRLFNICRISPSKTIGGLTERQRAELVYHLRP